VAIELVLENDAALAVETAGPSRPSTTAPSSQTLVMFCLMFVVMFSSVGFIF
jgi:hypothetical protein